ALSSLEGAKILTSEAPDPSYASFIQKQLYGCGILDTQSSKPIVAKPTKRVISHNGEMTVVWT
ncbi:unnamed protein product, partial [Ilex paraguariensis]